MILVISNWKKKTLYLICAAVVIIVFALIFSAGGQEPVELPLTEEGTLGDELDGGVEKVTTDNLKPNSKDLDCDEKSNKINEKTCPDNNDNNKEEESPWLKSLIDKFKSEE